MSYGWRLQRVAYLPSGRRLRADTMVAVVRMGSTYVVIDPLTRFRAAMCKVLYAAYLLWAQVSGAVNDSQMPSPNNLLALMAS